MTPTACNFTVSAGDLAGLIAGINTANGAPSPTNICFADSSTYLVTAVDNSVNAFLQIINTMTIYGNGSKCGNDDL